MQTPLYFAYGSNMLQKRIEARVGPVERVGGLTLPDFIVDFDDLGFAYMRPEKGSQVEGCLYKVTDKQIARLDYFEWYPVNYQKSYDLLPNRIIYYFYNHVPKQMRLPRLDYLNLILDGLVENNFTKTTSRLIEFKNKNYKLKKGSRHKLSDIL